MAKGKSQTSHVKKAVVRGQSDGHRVNMRAQLSGSDHGIDSVGPLGVEAFEIACYMILVKASIDLTTSTFSKLIKASKIRRRVTSAISTERCFIVVEIEDQPWSVISALSSDANHVSFDEIAKRLSKTLKTKSIFYNASDSPFFFKYRLFSKGLLSECFDAFSKDDVSSIVRRLGDATPTVRREFMELERLGGIRFSSSLRTPKRIPREGRFWRSLVNQQIFVDQFFVDQGAFVPEMPSGLTEAGDNVDLIYAGEGIGTRIDFVAID